MANMARLKHKLMKLLQLAKNRYHQRVIQHAQQHERERKKVKENTKAATAKLLGRGKEDKEIKKSSQEEQLWQLRAGVMREKFRGKKKEAMKRWSMTATSGGAYRGR